MFHRFVLYSLSFMAAWVAFMAPAHAARVKDISHVQGVRDNQLMGYGLVVGLDGTGDMGQAELTAQTTASMLTRQGIRVDKRLLMQSRNVAAVMVTATLGPFAQPGQKLDVTISSVGNARSLQGGTLLMTPLKGPDGNVYAVAQGALSTGGYQAAGPSGNFKVKNHLNVGRIPSGALIERAVALDLSKKETLRLNLFEPDFVTAVEIARKISEAFPPEKKEEEKPEAAEEKKAEEGKEGEEKPEAKPGEGEEVKTVAKKDKPKKPFEGIAAAVDASTVRIEIPEAFRAHVPQFIAVIEALEVRRDASARVVINERTGTVVLGGKVRISTVAIAHGNLNVEVSTELSASQPAPFRGGGKTVVLPNADVSATEGKAPLRVVNQGATIGDVVSALNAVGVSPRDLIAILQAIKAAGALDAKLVIQ